MRPSLLSEALATVRLIRKNPMGNGVYLQSQFEGLASLIEELVRALEEETEQCGD